MNCKEYEEWIKKKHEKEFPFAEDKNLMAFIKKNDIKIKNTNQDLIEIMKKYDKDYMKKINKEFGKTFKTLLKKKIEKLKLLEYKNYLGNTSEENENDEKYIETALNNIKDLDENKKKIILANNFMRRDGRDWLTDETREGKDINERIQKAQNEIGSAADNVIIRELKQSMNKEIVNQRALRDEKKEQLSKQKIVLEDIRKSCNSLRESYNLRVTKYNERKKNNNEDIEQYNKKNDEYAKDNTKFNKEQLDNERNNVIKEQEALKIELEEIKKDGEKLKKEDEAVEKERLLHNDLVNESNKFNDLANSRVELFNKLNDYITIDFSKDEIKINFNNVNNEELPEFEKELKQIELDSNSAYKDELIRIGKKILNEEKEKIILEKRKEFEQVLLKVIKEGNNLWNNCFNQAFSEVNQAFNTEDMKKIINNHIDDNKKKKGNKNDYYYMKNLDNKKAMKKAETKLNKENTIIVGNVYNDNKVWDSYCVIPCNNSKYFLYKSNDGNQPPKKLVNQIQELTGGYVPKINISNKMNEKELSEVNAVENNKIMINQIEDDKVKFVDSFESYSNFYNESRENKLNKKQKSYPEEYIRGLYNEIARRNNTTRISVVLFNRYFLNEKKDNEIDLEFLKKLYEILMNYNDINNDEKEILKKEYKDIIDVYNNVYHLIKQKEEEEQKVIEDIVKGKYKRSIKNIKNKKEETKPEQKEINPNKNEYRPDINEIRPNPNEDIPNQNKIKQNQNNIKPNQIESKPNHNEIRPNQNNIKPNQNEIRPSQNEIKTNRNQKQNEIGTNGEKNSENKSVVNDDENKENNNNNQQDFNKFINPMNDESLKLKSKNKNRAGENTMKGKDGIDVYNNEKQKGKQTKLPLLDDKVEDLDSKRILDGDITQRNKNNQNNENIYSKNINQIVQGSVIKDENEQQKKDENGGGNNEKSCCEKIGCIIF